MNQVLNPDFSEGRRYHVITGMVGNLLAVKVHAVNIRDKMKKWIFNKVAYKSISIAPNIC
ncbi:MAG: hypothetical protein LBK29_04175 [Oscillospiraceae bacterium]|nr:hypothetical protein [Oscillospiraceae bacterium]